MAITSKQIINSFYSYYDWMNATEICGRFRKEKKKEVRDKIACMVKDGELEVVVRLSKGGQTKDQTYYRQPRKEVDWLKVKWS